jgi:hypothetical protein
LVIWSTQELQYEHKGQFLNCIGFKTLEIMAHPPCKFHVKAGEIRQMPRMGARSHFEENKNEVSATSKTGFLRKG